MKNDRNFGLLVHSELYHPWDFIEKLATNWGSVAYYSPFSAKMNHFKTLFPEHLLLKEFSQSSGVKLIILDDLSLIFNSKCSYYHDIFMGACLEKAPILGLSYFWSSENEELLRGELQYVERELQDVGWESIELDNQRRIFNFNREKFYYHLSFKQKKSKKLYFYIDENDASEFFQSLDEVSKKNLIMLPFKDRSKVPPHFVDKVYVPFSIEDEKILTECLSKAGRRKYHGELITLCQTKRNFQLIKWAEDNFLKLLTAFVFP